MVVDGSTCSTSCSSGTAFSSGTGNFTRARAKIVSELIQCAWRPDRQIRQITFEAGIGAIDRLALAEPMLSCEATAQQDCTLPFAPRPSCHLFNLNVENGKACGFDGRRKNHLGLPSNLLRQCLLCRSRGVGFGCRLDSICLRGCHRLGIRITIRVSLRSVYLQVIW